MKIVLFLCLLFTAGCKTLNKFNILKKQIQPPTTPKREKQIISGVNSQTDFYDWLSHKQDPSVKSYLEQEASYTSKVLAKTKDNQEKIYQEMLERANVSKESLISYAGEFEYFYKYPKNSEFPVYYLRKNNQAARVILDTRVLAKGKSFFKLTQAKLSPNGRYLAYSTDTNGRRLNEIRLRDLLTNKDSRIKIKNVTSNFVWGNDSRHLFYVKQDTKDLRWSQVWRLDIETPDVKLIFEERDEQFNVSLKKSLNKESIFINSSSSTTSESLILNANKAFEDFKTFQPRYEGILYQLYDGGDRFYILTNYQATNFKIAKVSKAKRDKGFSQWIDIVEHNSNKYIEKLVVHKDFIGIQYKEEGVNQIKVLTRDLKLTSHEVSFDDSVYYASLIPASFYNSSSLQYQYETPTKPREDIAYHVYKHEPSVIREQNVPHYESSDYIVETLNVLSRDGKQIPVTMTYHKNTKKSSVTPLVLSGYGAYGITYEARYSKALPSLLDRGFIFAIAHVRGSSKKGRQWYLDGKILKKKNSFNDFIDVGNYFVENSMSSSSHMYAWGGSAGGLLVAASINESPKLFNGVIAEVPFVDVLNTMLDSSIPLTTSEYEEWGNPNKQEFFDYIKSYSPYDNIRRQNYPSILATTYWNDSQVQYFEPAKWIAKLREFDTSAQSKNLLKINFDGGHGGSSGRFSRLKEKSEIYSYLLMLEGDQ